MKKEFERLENIEDDTAQLKLLLKEEKEKNKEYIENTELLKKYIRENYISKDKIKEKIEKIESSINNLFGSANYDDELMGKLQYSLDILQELLEEVE